ncbi:hypothetical protein AHF37_09273 [Paragonimus kellicotti]|nr:hypothetical protein AHF37_09273 [Paragonimus kellicotti]
MVPKYTTSMYNARRRIISRQVGNTQGNKMKTVRDDNGNLVVLRSKYCIWGMVNRKNIYYLCALYRMPWDAVANSWNPRRAIVINA